ncbi:hypothetical protein MPER_03685 [Moniliophthora perniciosa FA553]|nr:hypothetical protein MPER_03685 [Moniliophthora perniciosa FA553]
MTVAQDLPSTRYTHGTNSANTHDTHTNGNGIHKSPVKVLDGFGTRAIHVGSEPSEETGAVIPAISLSTTYRQEGVGNHKGYEYSRSGNPNRNALERTLAALKAGGSEAIAFSSGSSTFVSVNQSLGPSFYVISVDGPPR